MKKTIIFGLFIALGLLLVGCQSQYNGLCQPANVDDYTIENLQKIAESDMVCYSDNSEILCYNATQMKLIHTTEFERAYSGSMHDFSNIMEAKGYEISELDEVPGIGYGGIIARTYSKANIYMKTYRIPDRCEKYLTEEIGAILPYDGKEGFEFKTKNDKIYWCTENWYLWEVNDEAMIDEFLVTMMRPNNLIEHSTITGVQIWQLDYEDEVDKQYFIINEEAGIKVRFSPISIGDRYISYYEC